MNRGGPVIDRAASVLYLMLVLSQIRVRFAAALR